MRSHGERRPFRPRWSDGRWSFYRAILGGQGAERKHEDGTLVRRGLSEKVGKRLTTSNERRLATEVLTRRVRHFTHGVIFGSRALIDRWFESNRQVGPRTQPDRTKTRCQQPRAARVPWIVCSARCERGRLQWMRRRPAKCPLRRNPRAIFSGRFVYRMISMLWRPPLGPAATGV